MEENLPQQLNRSLFLSREQISVGFYFLLWKLNQILDWDSSYCSRSNWLVEGREAHSKILSQPRFWMDSKIEIEIKN